MRSESDKPYTTQERAVPTQRQTGFSLVEMMIATVALVVMSAGIVGVTQVASSSLDTNAKVHGVHVSGIRALERLQRHVRASSWSTVKATVGFNPEPQLIDDLVALGAAGPYQDLTFETYVVNPDEPDGLPTLSNPFRLFLQPSAGEPANGLDDDDDGLIDERELVLDPPGQAPFVVATQVTAFGVTPNGRTLDFTVTVGATSNGTTLAQTASLAVEIRND